MKKDLDERLKWLNGEIYDEQWHWSDRDEAIKDLIEFMEYDEDEEEKGYDLFNHNCSWNGEGDYVCNSSLGNIIISPLEEALDIEFTGGGLALLEHFTEEQQEEILDFAVESKNQQLQSWYNDWRNSINEANKYAREERELLATWDCGEYSAREDLSRTIGLKYTISSEHMLKLENNYDEDVTALEADDMPL